jgi:hypothetical protein
MIRDTPETVESNWDGVASRWRAHFVNKLQDAYGPPEEEAGTKADAWLGWLRQRKDPKADATAGRDSAAVHARPGSGRLKSRASDLRKSRPGPPQVLSHATGNQSC